MTRTARAVVAGIAAVSLSVAVAPFVVSDPAPATFSVTLHWGVVKRADIVGYRVYRGTTLGHEATLLGSVPQPQNWFVDYRVPQHATGTYFYRLRTYTKTAVSAKSIPIVVDARGIPTKV